MRRDSRMTAAVVVLSGLVLLGVYLAHRLWLMFR